MKKLTVAAMLAACALSSHATVIKIDFNAEWLRHGADVGDLDVEIEMDTDHTSFAGGYYLNAVRSMRFKSAGFDSYIWKDQWFNLEANKIQVATSQRTLNDVTLEFRGEGLTTVVGGQPLTGIHLLISMTGMESLSLKSLAAPTVRLSTDAIDDSLSLKGTFAHAHGISSIQGSVTAVPEPSTYALLLAGLGAVSFVACRRKAA